MMMIARRDRYDSRLTIRRTEALPYYAQHPKKKKKPDEIRHLDVGEMMQPKQFIR
jgi:hypothetical protein